MLQRQPPCVSYPSPLGWQAQPQPCLPQEASLPVTLTPGPGEWKREGGCAAQGRAWPGPPPRELPVPPEMVVDEPFC